MGRDAGRSAQLPQGGMVNGGGRGLPLRSPSSPSLVSAGKVSSKGEERHSPLLEHQEPVDRLSGRQAGHSRRLRVDITIR